MHLLCVHTMGSLIHSPTNSCSHFYTNSNFNACWSNERTHNEFNSCVHLFIVFSCFLLVSPFLSFDWSSCPALCVLIERHTTMNEWTHSTNQCTSSHRGRKKILFFQLFSASSQFRCGFCHQKFVISRKDVSPARVCYERIWSLFLSGRLNSGKHSKLQFLRTLLWTARTKTSEWMNEWSVWVNGLFRLRFFQALTKK